MIFVHRPAIIEAVTLKPALDAVAIDQRRIPMPASGL